MSEPSKPAQTAVPSLVARLAAVEAAVSRIPKTGFNERQNYHYVTESDVMDCIRSTLAAQGVIIRHDVAEMKSEWRDTKSGGAMQWVSVKLTFTAHADNGETLDLGCMWGQGTDSAEKAIYKAVTGAVKYKLLKQFLMSSGDDPEAEKKPIHQERRPDRRDPPTQRGPAGADVGGPTTLPNYGPAKGAPIRDAKPEHLQVYLDGARKNLADPEKKRFHAQDSALIGAIEAELTRQRGAANSPKSSESSLPAVAKDTFSVAKELISQAATGEQVDKILNRAGPKVSTEEFAQLTSAGKARKAALVSPTLPRDPPLRSGWDGDSAQDGASERVPGGEG